MLAHAISPGPIRDGPGRLRRFLTRCSKEEHFGYHGPHLASCCRPHVRLSGQQRSQHGLHPAESLPPPAAPSKLSNLRPCSGSQAPSYSPLSKLFGHAIKLAIKQAIRQWRRGRAHRWPGPRSRERHNSRSCARLFSRRTQAGVEKRIRLRKHRQRRHLGALCLLKR